MVYRFCFNHVNQKRECHYIWSECAAPKPVSMYNAVYRVLADTRVFDLTNRHMGMMDNTPGFSMEERDPNNINLHLQVSGFG